MCTALLLSAGVTIAGLLIARPTMLSNYEVKKEVAT